MALLTDLLSANTTDIASNTAAVADAGGTYELLTSISVTARNSNTLIIGSSYINASYEDYFFELRLPRGGWANQVSDLYLYIELQFNNGNYNDGYTSNNIRMNGSSQASSSGSIGPISTDTATSGDGYVVGTHHFEGKILSTQVLARGATIVGRSSFIGNVTTFYSGLLDYTFYTDGSSDYTIKGMRIRNGHAYDFPIGTELYLYGINRS